MRWRMVGGRKRQLLFISMRGRPLWEDEWRGAFQEISESERVGRHQDIIREVCLLPCYYGWNKWLCCFRPEIHLPCVVSSGVKLIWWHSTCNSRLSLELMTLLTVENETKAVGLKPVHHMCRTTQLLVRFILGICQKCWKTTKRNVNKTKTSHRQRQIDFHQQWRLLNNVFQITVPYISRKLACDVAAVRLINRSEDESTF